MKCPNYAGCAQRPEMVSAGIGWLLRCPVCKTLFDPESGMIVEADMAATYNPEYYDNILDEEDDESSYSGVW